MRRQPDDEEGRRKGEREMQMEREREEEGKRERERERRGGWHDLFERWVKEEVDAVVLLENSLRRLVLRMRTHRARHLEHGQCLADSRWKQSRTRGGVVGARWERAA